MKNILNDENKRFFTLLFSLCIPIIIQQLISTSVNVIDTIMISSLGEESVASIGVANQYFFLFNMCLTGIEGGSGIFISQFFGKNDFINIKKITGLSIILSLGLSLLFFMPALFFPKGIINIFSNDPAVVKLTSEYFMIIVFSYPLTSISTMFSMSSRSIRNPKLGMICSSIALVCNIILNYLLIFGNLGFPALGVKGAAIATLIARILEFMLIVGYVYIHKKDYVLKFNINHLKEIDIEFLRNFLSKSMPVFINDATWALGSVLYSVAYAMAGTSAIAASQIASSTGNFFIITSICIGIGASIMLGNELGADNIDTAISYSKKFSVLVIAVGILFGMLLIVNIPLLLKIFSVENHLIKDMINIFVIMGIMLPLRAFNTYIIIGILRSGGYTKYALILELACMWICSIPLTFLAGLNGYPIYILVLLSYTEELVKFIFGVPRAISKKWATNIVKDMD